MPKLIDAPDGSKIDARPPTVGTNFSTKIVYADPAAVPAGEPFAASETANGVPLEQLGTWTQPPPGVKTGNGSTPSTTDSSSGASSDTAAASDTSAAVDTSDSAGPSSAGSPGVVSGSEGSTTDVCAGQPASTNCVTYSTGVIRLAHDAGTHSDFACPSNYPYLLGTWQQGTPVGADSGAPDAAATDSAAPASGDDGWTFTPTWTWWRDHWTITVWKTVGGGSEGIEYWAQNWNTVFGDAWHFQVMIPCGTSPTPKPT